MKYERLTARTEKGVLVLPSSQDEFRSIWNAIERLAELEDKIENGDLISIPFIRKRKKYDTHNEHVLVYEGKYGSLLVELFTGENAKARAEVKLKELQNGK